MNIAKLLYLGEALRESDTEHGFPCVFPSQIVIKFVAEFQSLSLWLEFGVVVEVARRVLGDVSKGLKVLVQLLLSVREIIQVERYLTMG